MADVIVSYKGSTIAEMSASGTKTLLTEGKYCEDDLVVNYTKPASGGYAISDLQLMSLYEGDGGKLYFIAPKNTSWEEYINNSDFSEYTQYFSIDENDDNIVLFSGYPFWIDGRYEYAYKNNTISEGPYNQDVDYYNEPEEEPTDDEE